MREHGPHAAADVISGAKRGRVMGLIVWGSTGGSIIGPNLLAPARALGSVLGVPPAASAFLTVLRRPVPVSAPTSK